MAAPLAASLPRGLGAIRQDESRDTGTHETDATAPTDSHAIAQESIKAGSEEEGALRAQNDGGQVEVQDLGWNNQDSKAAQPVINGLSNDQLWTLIRRFDKQTFHVKSIDNPPLAKLDMNIADDEEFSPDKLRAHLERLYTSIVVQLVSFWKHIVRLRSWREYQRTSVFFGVYVVAWLFDMLLPVVVAFLIVLVLVPESRDVCFPSAPPAIISSDTGGIQKPPAGVLGSDDTVTGAPESRDGEGAEQEAHSFLNNVATLLLSTSLGKHPQDTTNGPTPDLSAPDPLQIQHEVAPELSESAAANNTADDQTKRPVSKIVWMKAEQGMHGLSAFVDAWERLGNALSPTPPFPQRKPRLTLASGLVPILLATFFISPYMLAKGSGLAFGVLLFGDPILSRLEAFVSRTYPHWKKYIKLENSLLRGVPTNAQLAVTLLRIGEHGKAPIPPPRPSDVPNAGKTETIDEQSLNQLGASDEEIRNAVAQESGEEESAVEGVDEKSPKKTSRIVKALKGTTGGAISTILATDKIKAAAGRKHAQNRLGVVKRTAVDRVPGPVCFPSRYRGHKGSAYITTTATSPALSWTSDLSGSGHSWSISISDINELRKVGGLGWTGKMAVKWALEKKIADGLVVRTKGGDEYHLTALTGRDELFNRLIAGGSQMWESF